MTAVARLAAIKEREQNATEGPWEWGPVVEESAFLMVAGAGYRKVLDAWGMHTDGFLYGKPEDRAFIAHARTDIPALVAAVEKVLELHRPGKFHMRLTDGGWRYRCAGCGRPWDLDAKDGQTTRPCPTVRAVEEALG